MKLCVTFVQSLGIMWYINEVTEIHPVEKTILYDNPPYRVVMILCVRRREGRGKRWSPRRQYTIYPSFYEFYRTTEIKDERNITHTQKVLYRYILCDIRTYFIHFLLPILYLRYGLVTMWNRSIWRARACMDYQINIFTKYISPSISTKTASSLIFGAIIWTFSCVE